jgi:NAD(P)-dependent dehydrogenase (short-subunit alcohol dehydrogenase family)
MNQATTEGALSVVVTGGASGIGAAVCRRVVQAGGHAAILDLDQDAAAALARELGPRAAAAPGDVLDEAGLRAADEALAARLPPITGLVNCAGIAQVPTPIEDYPVQEWARVVDSHLKGTYTACRVFGSAMAARGRGAVVNVASVLSFRPGPVLAYGPAKAAVVNLTEALAVQWARQGVRVNAIAPGWTDTPFLRPKERQGERDMTPILRATPLGRLMRPEEIAEVVFFLLSPASAVVTGATIPCDGGVIAGSGWAPYGGFPADSRGAVRRSP